jgi:dienelactone hydrolase
MRTILLVFFICFAYPIFAQYNIGSSTLTYVDNNRNNRNVEFDVFFPVGQMPSTIAEGNFPLLVLGHGFVMTVEVYLNFRDYLVPKGYILILPKTEGGLSPNHQAFAEDLNFLIREVYNEAQQNAGSLFFNKLNYRSAIMGHSMGGGSAFLAVSLGTLANTIVTFAPANTNPSAINAATAVGIPTLIFAGQNDCVTPIVDHQQPIYNSCGSTCKVMINIKGGGHCFFANTSFTCNLGEASCSPQPSITREKQQEITLNYTEKWLNIYLKSNFNEVAVFNQLLNSDNDIIVSKACNALTNNKVNEDQIMIYPNPSATTLKIDLPFSFVGIISFYTVDGKFVGEKPYQNNEEISISDFEEGVYILTFQSKQKMYRKKLLIRK